MTFHVPEECRVRLGRLGSGPEHGNNGAFRVPVAGPDGFVNVIASDQAGWEHVSVSRPTATPTWGEMTQVAALFWDPQDALMQLRPPADDYVNHHPHCLHWWRPIHYQIPRPPAWMIGPLAAKGSIASEAR